MKAFPYSKEGQKIFFVAEIGSNHNQDKERLTQLIESACKCGFDAIKLQYYKADQLWSKEFPERIEAAKKGELSLELLRHANKVAMDYGISIGCSIFNKAGVADVMPLVNFLKISSYECLSFDLINECRKYATAVPLFISTGMCNRMEMYSILKMMGHTTQEDAMFHCTSAYPATLENANISILKAMHQSFSHYLSIGYSDHTVSEGVVLAAINAGIRIVEMHVDLQDMQGNESKYGHCWPPQKASELIRLAKDMCNANTACNWLDNFSSRKDREDACLRADLSDGKRPQLSARK